MDNLYPLKFSPIYKERIWGGNQLRTHLGKKVPDSITRCGESWEISAVQGSISVVSNGFLKGNNLQELVEVYMTDLVGERVYEEYGVEFPLLIKLIDAADDLSIQVHPNDELAKERHHAYGKTEMWYVIKSDKDSKIIVGFNHDVSPEVYLEHLYNKQLTKIINYEEARPDDIFFIPSGKIHAVGKGILLAEIQQTSDITYRIYDWDRVDEKGNSRELHTDLALEAINFRKSTENKKTIPLQLNSPTELISCRHFTTSRLSFNKTIQRDYTWLDSFIIFMCIQGEAAILYANDKKNEHIKTGETVLIPAEIKDIRLKPIIFTTILEIFVQQK